ncbi:MAG: methionine--tRNA ligase [Alphaproteobacteria bacterium]|nr:methionine--tRNA ligase [Alphaproteobacteria bacterium]
MKNKYLVTTPIYYVNDKPHIGHAYTSIAADVMARYMRLIGRDVLFLTGTDEHGQKVEKSAAAAGVAPQEFTDRVSQNFRDLTQTLNLSTDQFIRTTEPRHAAACQALWQRLVDSDQIYLGSYAGWYAVRDETFYAEADLVNGKAPTGADVEWLEEPSYFFRLSAWQDKLLAFYEQNPDFIAPRARRNEVLSWVKSGLIDLSISRTSFKWGIKVPNDKANSHVMYVWFDALINYITACGFPNQNGADWGYWPADLHLVGKDILRFHAVIWPAMLMAAGLPTPKRVFAHGWWTNEGQKISKSLGNVIDPLALVAQFGLDPVRYFMLREVDFGNDADFSQNQLISRVNTDLANGLGNLAQRTLALVQKNCGGMVPNYDPNIIQRKVLDSRTEVLDHDIIRDIKMLIPDLTKKIEKQDFFSALDQIWQLVTLCNRYIDEQAPWTLAKTDRERMNQVLYILLFAIRAIALSIQPFMPDSAAKLLDQLAVPDNARNVTLENIAEGLEPGTPLPPPLGVFPRLETLEKK